MKKQHIQFISILMAVALSGLLFLQFLWLKESIAVKEAHFSLKVNDVLQEVAEKLEEYEIVNYVAQTVAPARPATVATNQINTKAKHKQVKIKSQAVKGHGKSKDHRQGNTDQPIKTSLQFRPPSLVMAKDSMIYVDDGSGEGVYPLISSKFLIPFLVDEENGEGNTGTLGILFDEKKTGGDNSFEKALGLDNDEVEEMPVDMSGVEISDIVTDSPADKAGLKKGDIVTGINEAKINNADDLVLLFEDFKPGDEISITYRRNELVYAPPKASGLSAESGRVYAPLINQFGSSDPSRPVTDDIEPYWKRQDSEIITQATLIEKRKVINDNRQRIIAKVFQEVAEGRQPLQNRVDDVFLYQTLHSTLHDAGMEMPFEYGLFTCEEEGSEANCMVYSSSASSTKALETSTFRKNIFYNSFNEPSGELLLHLPDYKQHIWTSSQWSLMSTLFFNLVIIGLFTYSLRTIIRQKRLSDMKTDFINNMTHELKTPISTIKLASEMLTDNNLPKTEKRINRYANIIQEENHRLQNHVEKVLQFARLEKGSLKLNVEALDMHQLVAAAVQKIALKIQKQNGNMELVLSADKCLIDGDQMHLTNVIYNLLDNAIKYSKDAPNVFITTKNVGENFVVSIKDHGIGMSKETLKKIFDKFYRVPTGNIHNVKGFGLGLSYVKLMVEAHEGTITARSRIDKGSTFEIAFPVKSMISE